MNYRNEHPQVWWVNHNKTFSLSKAEGCLWAPILTSTGKRRWHWDNLELVKCSDITVHCQDYAIVALGHVISAAYEAPGPNGHEWASWHHGPGRRVDVLYFDLASPVPVIELAQTIRALDIHQGPLDKNMHLKQGYLLRFGTDGLRILRRISKDVWPGWASAALDVI